MADDEPTPDPPAAPPRDPVKGTTSGDESPKPADPPLPGDPIKMQTYSEDTTAGDPGRKRDTS